MGTTESSKEGAREKGDGPKGKEKDRETSKDKQDKEKDGSKDRDKEGANGRNRPVKKKQKKEKDIRKTNKSKKRKSVKRGTSPSHFYVPPAEEIKFGPEFTLELPGRDRIDSLLRAVSRLYYREKEVNPNGTSVWVNGGYDSTEYPTLDLLLSPLRQPNSLDLWSPREIALFELGMCRVGKDFHHIQSLVATKSTQDIVDFYYHCWKKSAHYQIWKQTLRKERGENSQQTNKDE